MSCVTIIFGTYKQHLINNNDDNKLMSSICLLITSLRITTGQFQHALTRSIALKLYHPAITKQLL
jgi:uncharacterized membrane protein